MIQGPDGHAIFAAWNTKHEATTVDLPDRGHERGWRVVVDTGKPAPYDIMVADHWCVFLSQRHSYVPETVTSYPVAINSCWYRISAL